MYRLENIIDIIESMYISYTPSNICSNTDMLAYCHYYIKPPVVYSASLSPSIACRIRLASPSDRDFIEHEKSLGELYREAISMRNGVYGRL